MKNISYFIVLTLVCGVAIAGDKQQTLAEQLADKVSSEYSVCAAYYQIVSVGLERVGEMDGVASVNSISETAFQYAYLAAQKGRSEEMARKVVQSRIEIYAKEMLGDIDYNMSNISILANKHSHSCKYAIGKPDAFMEGIAAEIIKKDYE